TGVVHQIARGKIVGAVGDDIEFFEQLKSIVARKPRVEFLDVEKRIHRLELVSSGIEFGTAYVGGGVNDLALQVRVVHDVEIHDAERADAGCAKIERQRRPEASRADAEHFRSLQLQLPF